MLLRCLVILTCIASLEIPASSFTTGCSGLFLLDNTSQKIAYRNCYITDSVEVANSIIWASYQKDNGKIIWKDDWRLSLTRSEKIASIGVASDFKYISLETIVSGTPWISTATSLHDSKKNYELGIGIGYGEPTILHAKWTPEEGNDILPEIKGDLQSHILQKNIFGKATFYDNEIGINASIFASDPFNPEKKYYLRDSTNTLVLEGTLAHHFADSKLLAKYLYVDIDSKIYAISKHDGDQKRFLYLPIETTLHSVLVQWQNEFIDLHAIYANFSFKIDDDGERFHETLAPNRALEQSLLQTLSFSFLQKTFRVEAEISGNIIVPGIYYTITSKSSRIQPRIGFDAFYMDGNLDIQRKSETTKFITKDTEIENFLWELKSFGSIAGLGLKIVLWNSPTLKKALSIEWNASQIIPFSVDLEKRNFKNQGESTETQSSTNAKAIRNGFYTDLGLTLQF